MRKSRERFTSWCTWFNSHVYNMLCPGLAHYSSDVEHRIHEIVWRGRSNYQIIRYPTTLLQRNARNDIYLPFVEGLKFLPFCYSRAYTQQRLFIQRNVECEEREFQDSVQFLKNLEKLMSSVCFASLVCFREVSTPASPIIFERGVKRYCSNWKHQWTILLWQNCQHMRSQRHPSIAMHMQTAVYWLH